MGTIISDHNTGEMLGDLIQDEQELTILIGGIGGKGNKHFATSTNRSPRYAQSGIPGEKKDLKLILKQLADIGLIGLPNAGKSTLLSRITMAHPKIDGYPFTTIVPNLGIMDLDNGKSFTIADIPGLIEGASLGKGLGHRFLRHIERTKFLLHVIDISQAPADDPLKDYNVLEDELKKYNPSLLSKKRIIVVNKIDLERADGLKTEDLILKINKAGHETISVSALTGKGIDELKSFLSKSMD